MCYNNSNTKLFSPLSFGFRRRKLNMNETTPFFSVILPVHNGADTLNTAILSIVTQSYSDYELLIIENASDDGSLDIARAFEKSFEKIRVFHLDEPGASRARNLGLDNARGKYAVFLDADDRYVPSALRIMHTALEGGNDDLLVAGFTNYALNENGEALHPSGRELRLALLDPVLHYSRMVPNCVNNDFLLRAQCAKAYRLEMLNGASIRFNEDCPIYEDFFFNKAVFSVCKSSSLIFKRLYHYAYRPGSLSSRAGAPFIADAAAAFTEQAKHITSPDKTLRDAELFSAFMMLARAIQAHAARPSEGSFELLSMLLNCADAQAVIAEVRGENLHLISAEDAIHRSLLFKLRQGDILAAIDLAVRSIGRDEKEKPND